MQELKKKRTSGASVTTRMLRVTDDAMGVGKGWLTSSPTSSGNGHDAIKMLLGRKIASNSSLICVVFLPLKNYILRIFIE